MSDYASALERARVVGASRCDDRAFMALYCDTILRTMVGAASPQLVWEGAQRAGMATTELSRLAVTDPARVCDLMW